jgi:hypothetical protein
MKQRQTAGLALLAALADGRAEAADSWVLGTIDATDAVVLGDHGLPLLASC